MWSIILPFTAKPTRLEIDFDGIWPCRKLAQALNLDSLKFDPSRGFFVAFMLQPGTQEGRFGISFVWLSLMNCKTRRRADFYLFQYSIE